MNVSKPAVLEPNANISRTFVTHCLVETAQQEEQRDRAMVKSPVDNTPGDYPGGRYN